MRNVKGRWEGRFFSDLIQAKYLGDLDDFVAVAGKILKGDCTIAGAQVNSEAETRAHVIGDELSLRSGEAKGLYHLSSTSAGAIDGNRSVFTMRGSFTNSVFQPL
jgi:hypothetical protein